MSRGRATFRDTSFMLETSWLRKLGECPFACSLDVAAEQEVARIAEGGRPYMGLSPIKISRGVCPSSLPFYRITGLLPAVRRRKQDPSDSLLTSRPYENP